MQRQLFPSGRRLAGFSLIELLVAVAVVGILSAIAYPAYTQHIVKANRAAGQAYLLSLAQSETEYFADARTYATTTSALNLDMPANVAAKYTIDIQTTTTAPQTFKLTLIPIPTGSQANDGRLSIDSAGDKQPSDKW